MTDVAPAPDAVLWDLDGTILIAAQRLGAPIHRCVAVEVDDEFLTEIERSRELLGGGAEGRLVTGENCLTMGVTRAILGL